MLSPELGNMEFETESMLYEEEMSHMEGLEKDGLLRDGLTTVEACDIAFSMHVPGLYRRLRTIRGWSRERYVDLVSDVLARTLLKDPTC